MIYSIYDSTTGQIQFTIFGDHPVDLTDQNFIEGAYTDREHYVDLITKSIVNKPQQPSDDYEWSWDSKSWILNTEKSTDIARSQRNELLSAVDRVNPVWYGSLTTEQQQELAAYRTALLNVPQQSGFPGTIEWPTKPSWL